ncbi:MAG: hypothetical protein Q7V62_06765, partial [Actinomycetota bacterium]|nr:hypothetical protein [Actinomycetota bacterium]
MNFQVDVSYAYKVQGVDYVEKPSASLNDDSYMDTFQVYGNAQDNQVFISSLPSLDGSETQKVKVDATSGNFTLSYTSGGNVYTTGNIAYNATAAQIEAALANAKFGGSVSGETFSVERVNAGEYKVSFDTDGARGLMTFSDVDLAGGADTVTVSRVTPGSIIPVDYNPRVVTASLTGPGTSLNLTFNNVYRDPNDPSLAGVFTADNLQFYGEGGNDRLNATGMLSDFAALKLAGGDGSDILVGSAYRDYLDGGTGSDQYTGGEGVDVFADAGGAGDTLLERFDLDMTLFDNYFIYGVMMGDDGAAFDYADTTKERDVPVDPAYPIPTVFGLEETGDNYATADVEYIDGIFEFARLTGGTSANVMVMGDADGIINIAGQAAPAEALRNFEGTVWLDNVSNYDNGSLSEYYIVVLDGDSSARINIVDSGGIVGVDELVVFGTEGDDRFSLLAAPPGLGITAGVIVGGELYDTGVPYTIDAIGEQISIFRKVGETDATAPLNAVLTGTGAVTVEGTGSGQHNLVRLDVSGKSWSYQINDASLGLNKTYAYTAIAADTLDDVAAKLAAVAQADLATRETLKFTGAVAGTTAGNFVLAIDGKTTASIAWSDTDATLASSIQTALNTALGNGRVTVSATATNDEFLLVFSDTRERPNTVANLAGITAGAPTFDSITYDAYANRNDVVITASGSTETQTLSFANAATAGTTGTFTLSATLPSFLATTTAQGSLSAAEDQRIVLPETLANAGSASFTLTINGNTTAPITWVASEASLATAIQGALNAVGVLGAGAVTVTSTYDNGFEVSFNSNGDRAPIQVNATVTTAP